VRFLPPATVARASCLQTPPDIEESLPQSDAPLTAAALASVPPRETGDARVRRGLDSFYMSVTGWYHTAGPAAETWP